MKGDSSWLCSVFPQWVSRLVFPPFSVPSFCGLDAFWAHKRLVDSPLWWAEGVLQTDYFPGSCPGVSPHLLLFEKLSRHVLKKPAEEMLSWFPLGQAPKQDTKDQWFTPVESQSFSTFIFLLFPVPIFDTSCGESREGGGRVRDVTSALAKLWDNTMVPGGFLVGTTGRLWIVLKRCEDRKSVV